MWELNSQFYEACIKQELQNKQRILRFGGYSFTFKTYIIIQQRNEVLVFLKDTLEYKGCYTFSNQIRRFMVIDNILYIDSESQVGELVFQKDEDLFSYFNRLNPGKQNVQIQSDLSKISYLNLDKEVIGYIVSGEGQNTFLHNSMIRMRVNDIEIQQYLSNLNENSLSFDLGSNLQKQDGNFVHILAQKSTKMLQFIQKRIIQLNKKKIPNFIRHNKYMQTPFDLARTQGSSEYNYQSMIILLDLMVKFQNHTEFNYLVDPYINVMLKKKIDLQEYFNSNLPLVKINHKSYPDYSYDHSEVIFSNFDQELHVQYIMSNYDDIFKNYKPENEDQGVNVEFFLVNIPLTLKSREFIQYLSQQTDLDIFEFQLIQIILDYKWQTYTNKFYLKQFSIFLIFLVAYLIDLYFFVIQDEDRSLTEQLLLKLTCVICLISSGIYEITQMKKQELRLYFSEGWNYFDLYMIVHYFAILIIDAQILYPEIIVILQIAMILLIFIKLCQFLRIFEGLSFQVTMLQAVFIDIKYFILLYVFVIFMYGLIFTLLEIQTDDVYDGISYFGYFIMAFRASTGDFQTDNFNQLANTHIIVGWIMWISAVLFLNIILLNFIIAVISESYGKVMQKMVAESYRIKCQLIKERELFFNDKVFEEDNEKFPKYLILRRPIQEKEGGNSDWQGFVKDIKKTILKSKQQLQQEGDNKHLTIVNQLAQQKKEQEDIREDIKNLHSIFMSMQEQQKQSMEKLDQILELQNSNQKRDEEQDSEQEEEKE